LAKQKKVTSRRAAPGELDVEFASHRDFIRRDAIAPLVVRPTHKRRNGIAPYDGVSYAKILFYKSFFLP
jgi:hypothetical protein